MRISGRHYSSALFVIALAFFFLPWMTLSCEGSEITMMSGFDALTLEEIELDVAIDGQDVSYTASAVCVYIALLAGVLGALAFLVGGKNGRRAQASLGIVGVLALLGVMLTAAQKVSGFDAPVEISWRIGFWLTMAGFIAAAAVRCVPLPAEK